MVVFLNAKDGQVSRRAVALGSVAVRERFCPCLRHALPPIATIYVATP